MTIATTATANSLARFRRAVSRTRTAMFGRDFRFLDRDGREIRLRLDAPAAVQGEPAKFIIGVAKGGSTMMNAMCRDILTACGSSSLNIASELFRKGINLQNVRQDLDGVLSIPGAAYIGFRHFPPILEQAPLFKEGRKLLLIRDPRDVIVSLYFSHAYSHSIPGGEAKEAFLARREKLQNQSIEVFVEETKRHVLANFMRTAKLLAWPDTLTVLKYENVIFDKPRLVDELARVLGVTLTAAARADVVARHDIVPKEENRFHNIRNVHPGDHARKLSQSVVDDLNETFAPVYAALWPEGRPDPAS